MGMAVNEFRPHSQALSVSVNAADPGWDLTGGSLFGSGPLFGSGILRHDQF